MYTYRNFLLFVFVLFVHTAPAKALAQGTPDTERQKEHLVFRLYQATYGAEKRCSASPEGSASIGKSLEIFRSKFPELIRLLDGSPYFGPARDNFQKFLENPSTKVGDTALLLECESLEYILRSFIDAPGGNEAIAEYIQLLKK
jgi:hypothetical protein